MTQKKYITDFIGDSYKEWSPGDRILIDAQTGTGKTIFVLTTLFQYCVDTNKKILYVCNRKTLLEQIQTLAKDKNDIISVVNYQYLEHGIVYLSDTDYTFLFRYDFIVFDEAHYFNNDSDISQYTDIIFNEIPNINSIILFITATPQILNNYLEQQKISINFSYNIDKDYSYIRNIIFYDDKNTAMKILESLSGNDKAIYFSNNIGRALEYHEKLSNSCFLCSKNQSKYRKDISYDERDLIIKENKFESQILISTSSIDNGVSLQDENIKFIIIDIPHLITLIQCVGRKRITDESDKIILFIRKPSGKAINFILSDIKKKADIIHMREKLSREDFEKLYKKVDCHKVLNTDLSINYAVKAKIEWDLNFYQNCLSDKDFYVNTIKAYFLRENTETEHYTTFMNKYDLEQYLNIEMDTNIKNEFKTFMKEKFLSTNKAKYRTNGLNVINNFFEDNQYNYILTQKRDMSHRYWILTKKC